MADRVKPPETFGDFEVLEELSRTSRSRVFKAVEPPSQRPVVVKVLPEAMATSPEFVERYQQDVEALRKINDSNVVLVLDDGEEVGSLYLVMEFVPLSALSRILRRRRFDLAESIAVFKKICLGLRAVHEQKVVHRNLNPTSILVSDDLSMIKVAGFGSNADLTDLSSEMETLATGRLNVAIHYLAPEMVEGGAASERSDIYSLGIVLYEMLTGRIPMGRVGLPSRINTELPADVDRLVLDCLEKVPEDRFASVDDVLSAVQSLEDRLRLGVVSEFTGLVRGTTQLVRRRAGGLAVLGVLGALALGFGVFWALGGDDVAEESENSPTAIRVAAPETIDRNMDSGSSLPTAPPPTEDVGGAGDATVAVSAETGSATTPDAGDQAGAEPEAPVTPKAVVPRASAAGGDLDVARQKLQAGLQTAALVDLQELVAKHAGSREALDAYLLMAGIHAERKNPDAARAALFEARSRYARDPRVAEAVFRLAELTAAERGRRGAQEARDLFGEVAAKYPRSEWAPKALAAKARLEDDENLKVQDAELERRVPAELVTYRELVARYPKSRQAEGALWILGGMYSDLKRFDLAVQAYAALGGGFPKTPHDAWWEAAQLYEKRLKDDGAAADAYARVTTTSSHYEAAQKRRRKLGGG